jgi:glycine cleavage system H protein
VRVEGDEAVLGITDYAQDQLGDIVFVELPAPGRVLAAGDAFGVVESIKAVSDLYAPVAGEVLAVKEALAEHPEQVNADPYGAGWLIRVRLDGPLDGSALLSAEAYRALRVPGA